MATYSLALTFTGNASQTGLTVKLALSDDLIAPRAAPYRDVGSWTERPAANYGRVITIPNGFRGWAVFYTGTIGAGGGDFSGVTVLAAIEINPEESETGRINWAYTPRTLTSTPSQQAVAAVASTVSMLRGDSQAIQITGLGDITGRTKCWFTAKRQTSDPDSAAMLQIEETADLLVIAGKVPTSETATLTVDDQAAGDITIKPSPAAAQLLQKMTGAWDVQIVNASGDVVTMGSGEFVVSEDVTIVQS